MACKFFCAASRSALRFYQRIAGGKHFFLGSSGRDGQQLGFSAFDLRLGARDLGAGVGVVQLEKQLVGLNPGSLQNCDPLDGGGHGSVGFEVVDGLNFTVGGDAGGDGFAVGAGGADLHLRTAERED